MEDKIWDILENVRQGYLTVNEGTQQVLSLYAAIENAVSDEAIRKHMIFATRRVDGTPAMDEQVFYEGAKWLRSRILEQLKGK